MFNEFEKNNRGMRVNRRTVLRGTSGIVGTALVAPLVSAQSEGPVSFTHGVASGDPLQDRVILWTRVAPSDNTARNLQIEWQVSADKEFANVIASGGGSSGPASDFTFKTDASGLKADRTYYYRFTCEGVTSETGRTRTLAASGTDPLSLAVVSCSNYPQGFFHVYKEIAKRDVAMVLHLGDYLYEYPAGGYSNERMTGEFGRKVDPKGEVIALDDYRRRYALYRTDPDLQAVHAAHPFVCVWDDHEIANDTWRTGAQNHNEGEGPFEARKKAALQAYHEWLPIRENAEADHSKIYRSFELGDLASLIMLDTRLVGRSKPLTYGEDLPLRSLPFRFEEGKTPVFSPDESGDGVRQVPVPFKVNGADAEPITDWAEIQALDPKNLPKGITYLPDLKKFKDEILPAADRTMLGDAQQNWFDGALQSSTASGKPWQIIGQQVLSGKVGIPNIPDEDIDKDKGSFVTPAQIAQFRALSAMGLPLNLDAWDGYPAARDQLLASIKMNGTNAVMLAGDTHNAWAFDLADNEGDAVGVEFGTAGVSSPGMEEYLPVAPDKVRSAIMARSPELKFLDSQRRGWLELDITMEAITARFEFVSTVREKAYEVEAPTIKRVSTGAHKLD
ncbi:MAG: alkaline phosphatase D family protein [Kordiimonadaceae bacterium]|nr:alkaline phosphatase D family protein [Kordiimonadaceae bacterium]MBO6567283.1 alkaline phosphatase D family protein [Kordiimonadaceae bacterium]MBO6963503.1 alkaline phosphatase D family protein [Kordiimonadaceae bacterium]